MDENIRTLAGCIDDLREVVKLLWQTSDNCKPEADIKIKDLLEDIETELKFYLE